jgi:hypothetical protein
VGRRKEKKKNRREKKGKGTPFLFMVIYAAPDS